MLCKTIRTIGTIGCIAWTILCGGEGFLTAARAAEHAIVIGSADFPENQLLATIYAQALAAKGVKVTLRPNIGSREVYMPALKDGSIDFLPEYTGSTLAYLDPNATARTPEDVAAALKAVLPKGVSMAKPSAAQNADVLTVKRATAEKYGLKKISDLAPVAKDLVLGGPPEWKTRKEGVVGLRTVYGLTFKSFKGLDAGGPLSLSALTGGQIQVADMFSSDPAMTENDLIALEDDKNLFSAQNIVPIMAESKASNIVVETADAVSTALTTKDIIKMNEKIAKYESYDAVAKEWLSEKGIK